MKRESDPEQEEKDDERRCESEDLTLEPCGLFPFLVLASPQLFLAIRWLYEPELLALEEPAHRPGPHGWFEDLVELRFGRGWCRGILCLAGMEDCGPRGRG